ncbi:hypothetical protein Tco_0151051 [Tanacetum coccineum]
MTGAKFDIKKFDGTGDFGLWRMKMRALLIQHGCEEALEVLPANMEAEAKAELNKKAHSAVICVSNKVCIEHKPETLCWIPLRYGRKLLTLEDVMATPNSKEIKEGLRRRGIMVKGYIEIVRRIIARVNIDGQEEIAKPPSVWTYDDSEVICDEPTGTCSTNMIMDSDVECKIRGIGKVRVQLRDGSSFVLNNVRYIPELKRNLISLGTLEKEGYTVKMQSGKVKGFNGELMLSVKKSEVLAQFGIKDWDISARRDYRSMGLYSQVQTRSIWKVQRVEAISRESDWEDVAGATQMGSRTYEQNSPWIRLSVGSDRERRTRTKPLRFQDESNMAAYAFAAAEEEDTHEPLSYTEEGSLLVKISSKWKAARKKR